MIIKDNKKVTEIQKEFSNKFPFLKIEFYKKSHQAGEGSIGKEQYPADAIIGDIRINHASGDLSINGHLKVETFEKNFSEQYGLHVQVFRKSGDLWLQTTSTDNWTLSEQNNHGQETNVNATTN